MPKGCLGAKDYMHRFHLAEGLSSALQRSQVGEPATGFARVTRRLTTGLGRECTWLNCRVGKVLALGARRGTSCPAGEEMQTGTHRNGGPPAGWAVRYHKVSPSGDSNMGPGPGAVSQRRCLKEHCPLSETLGEIFVWLDWKCSKQEHAQLYISMPRHEGNATQAKAKDACSNDAYSNDAMKKFSKVHAPTHA